MSSEAVDFRILAGGRNWVQFTSYMSVSLACYDGFLPHGSTVSIVAGDPGSACMDSPYLVAEGKYDLGVTTPSWYGGLAAQGLPPFTKPLPLRALAVLPHDDRLVFAVKPETGITSLEDIRDKKYPLKVMMCEPALRHPSTWMIDEVLKGYGFSMDDILSWGGKLLTTQRKRTRIADGDEPARPEFDAVFDEAIMTKRWELLSRKYALRFLGVRADVLSGLAARGMPSAAIAKGRLQGIDQPVHTVDFSGWLLFCREDMPANRAADVVASLVEQAPSISASFNQPGAGLTGPLDPAALCQNSYMPLHKGAEDYYRSVGAMA
jgi:TRAP-type uncharacterized transport system substrate-binding protein